MIDAVDAVVVVVACSHWGPGKRAGLHRTELQAAATLVKESVASLKFRSNGVKLRTHVLIHMKILRPGCCECWP